MERNRLEGDARQRPGGVRAAAVQRQWDQLTADDVDAAGNRGSLARTIAARYGISVRHAKRQVRNFGRTMRIVQGGRASGGKRARKAAGQAAEAIADSVSDGFQELRRRLGRVLSMTGLAGERGAREAAPVPVPDFADADAVRVPVLVSADADADTIRATIGPGACVSGAMAESLPGVSGREEGAGYGDEREQGATA